MPRARCAVPEGLRDGALARGSMKNRSSQCCFLLLAVSALLTGRSLFFCEAHAAEESAARSPDGRDKPFHKTPETTAGRTRRDQAIAPNGETKSLLFVPPLKRLGALHVTHNTEAFRAAYGERISFLSGFLASPWHGSEAGARLDQLIKQSSIVSKRFWYLSNLATVPVASSPRVKSLFERQYQLDGWVGFRVTFAPDYTRISVSLYRGENDGEPGSSNRTENQDLLVSDGLDIGPQPDEAALVQAFVRLWARVGNALGHLGSVEWQSGDLVSLNVGSGLLQDGEAIEAGRIQIEVTHPRTSEVLRVKRWPAVRLQVIETQAHTSLARIVAGVDAEAVQDVRGYLFWKNDGARGLHEPVASASVTLPEQEHSSEVIETPDVMMGEAPRGYVRPPESLPRAPLNVPGPEHDREWMAHNAAGRVSEPPEQASQEVLDEPNPDPVLEAPTSSAAPSEVSSRAVPAEASGGSQPFDSESWVEAIVDLSRWRLVGAHFAVGQSWGSLNTSPCANKPCERYSGFPSSLLNLVGGGTKYAVTRSADLNITGEFNLFGGNDVEGYELSAKALSVHQVARLGRDVVWLVAGPELSVGSVETVLSEVSLLHASLLTGGHYGFRAPEWGTFRASLELSLLELLEGNLAYHVGIEGRSFFSLPPPLGVFFGFRRAGTEWSEVVLGATWDL